MKTFKNLCRSRETLFTQTNLLRKNSNQPTNPRNIGKMRSVAEATPVNKIAPRRDVLVSICLCAPESYLYILCNFICFLFGMVSVRFAFWFVSGVRKNSAQYIHNFVYKHLSCSRQHNHTTDSPLYTLSDTATPAKAASSNRATDRVEEKGDYHQTKQTT